MKPIRLAVAGAGNPGRVYAGYALRHPGRARAVAVAEPRDDLRERLARLMVFAAERARREGRVVRLDEEEWS